MPELPPPLETKLSATGLSRVRWETMRAGIERFDRWLEDQVVFGLAAWELDPLATLEPVAASLTDDQLGGPAAKLRTWISIVGEGGDWAKRIGNEMGYWHLLNRMALQGERLDTPTFAGVVFAFGYRLQRAKLDTLGTVAADTWTCIGMEEGNEQNLFFRRTHWRGTTGLHAGSQQTYNYGSPLPASSTRIGEGGQIAMLVYPDGLPGRTVLPQGATFQKSLPCPHHFAAWGEQRAEQRALIERQPWRQYFPVAVGPVRAEVSRAVFGAGRVHLVDADGCGVSIPLPQDAQADQRALQLLALVGADPFVLFAETYPGGLKPLSVWLDGSVQAL